MKIEKLFSRNPIKFSFWFASSIHDSLDNTILHLQNQDIIRTQISHAGAEVYEIIREKPKDEKSRILELTSLIIGLVYCTYLYMIDQEVEFLMIFNIIFPEFLNTSN